jgi:hypothetical protein
MKTQVVYFNIFFLIVALFVISCEKKEEEPNLPLKDPVPSAYELEFISELHEELSESSALAEFNNTLWTLNDKGNENILYQLDTNNGSILKKVKIANAENIDWESMTQSNDYLFIGDFGNNAGNRVDLVILKLKKSDLLAFEEVNAEKIFFSYPDQNNLNPVFQNHNFDCEAFFFANNELHLFTKNWEDNRTNYYTVPDKPGNQLAEFKESFDVACLITDADINRSTGDIILLGYTNAGISSQSFIWLFSDYTSFDIFQGENNKIILGNVRDLGQTEGIVIREDNSGWITSEEILVGPIRIAPKLFKYDFKGFL